MNLRRPAACLAVATAVPVAARNVNCSVYCPPPTVGVSSSNVNTSNAGGLTGTVKSGDKSGQSVRGYFASVSSDVASQLEADAKAGARVDVSLADTAASRVLAKALEAAGAHVTLVKASTDVSVAVTRRSAYISTGVGVGVGVAIKNRPTLDTLKSVLAAAGKNRRLRGHRRPLAARVCQQIPDLEPDHVLAEPAGCDTAAALAFAMSVVGRRHPGAVAACRRITWSSMMRRFATRLRRSSHTRAGAIGWS